MASALRQLPTGVRSTPARLRATARPKARVSSYHVAAATRTRRRGAVGARTLPVGPRQYWVRAGEDELSEESKKKLDEETRINLGKSKPHLTTARPSAPEDTKLTDARQQRYPPSRTASRQSSSSPSPPTYSPPISPSISSPRRTRIFPSPTAKPPTKQLSGPPLSPGTASP